MGLPYKPRFSKDGKKKSYTPLHLACIKLLVDEDVPEEWQAS